MDFALVQVIGLLTLTYAASRLTLRLGSLPATASGLRIAHIAAAAAVCLLDFVVKYASTGFLVVAPLWIVPFQLGWYWIDARRGRVPAGA